MLSFSLFILISLRRLGIYLLITSIFLTLLISTSAVKGENESALQTPTPQNYQIVNSLNNLINNPNCTLPCWWGLTLNVSTLTNLQTLSTTNFNETYAVQEDDTHIRATNSFNESLPNISEGRGELLTSFWFSKQNNKLAAIGFDIGNIKLSYVDYSAYNLVNILSIYGQPSEATIGISTGSASGYNLRLGYENLGLHIVYYMEFPTSDAPVNFNSGFTVCNNHTSRIRLWVEKPNLSYSQLMRDGLWQNIAKRLVEDYDIQGISNLSLSQFTQLFSQPNNCFQTFPLDQWVEFAETVNPNPTCTFNPTTSATLITSIQNANSSLASDTICLVENGNYTFSAANLELNALPVITSNIWIIGNGATLTRQSGAANFRLFEVAAAGALTLENLTLSGGKLPNEPGGAITNYGTLTLNTVTLTGNQALTGGAVDNQDGTLTIVDSTFQNNTASYGGALDNDTDSTLNITSSTFTGNTVTQEGGAIDNNGVLTITASQFANNTAWSGGAINNTDTANISGSTFSTNTASASGGAIRNTASLQMDSSILDNNTALGTTTEGWGGAIYNLSAGEVTLSVSTVSNNDAKYGGGIRSHGILNVLDNSQLTGNSASHRGGGIYNAGGTLTLTHSALLNNTATGDGGAIYVTSTGSQVTITGSTVSGNTSGASGGAIRNSQSMTITDSVFSNNTATSNYGSLYLTSSSTTTAHNSCFSGNSATSVGFTGTTMQDFTGNWWGAANGPSGSGSGTGDAVNNRINYANFLTAGCPHP